MAEEAGKKENQKMGQATNRENANRSRKIKVGGTANTFSDGEGGVAVGELTLKDKIISL
jgi:hypothetical protein